MKWASRRHGRVRARVHAAKVVRACLPRGDLRYYRARRLKGARLAPVSRPRAACGSVSTVLCLREYAFIIARRL